MLSVVALFGIGLAVPSAASAAPAPAVAAPTSFVAGNGTNDFYLKGSVNIPYSWTSAIGIRMWATNWDYGSNQKYHLACKTSGSGYKIDQMSIDGLSMGTNCDQIRVISGHGAHNLCITGHAAIPGGNWWTGCFRL